MSQSYGARFSLAGLIAVSALLCCSSGQDVAAEQPPNIVLIMADDMGFSDLGCYGSEIETPHLDALAAGGLRYTRFYNTSRCCPSRASLMTGKYQHQVDMGWMTAVDEHRPGYRGQLSADHPTIAELLHRQGYQTRMVGKWHLTVNTNYIDTDDPPNGSWPTQRGFEHFYGGLSGGGDYWKPNHLARDLTMIPKSSLPADYYYTHAITEHSVRFIEQSDPTRPLFLYVAHYAPHRPIQAPAERIEPCRDRYRVGYDQLRKQRFARQQELGFFAKDTPLGEPGLRLTNKSPTWTELNRQQQRRWIEQTATYAAMVQIMDDGIGEIVAALKERGQLENTLIVFLSDNGGTKEGGLDALLRGDLCNTPYRNYKQYTHLGGVASPLVMHWPAGIDDHGALRRDEAHINDLLPTLLAVAGGKYPSTFNGKEVSPPDGSSLAGTMQGQSLPPRPLFFEHQSSRAVQHEGWRLVALDRDTAWELYHLQDDPFEQNDLAQQQPEKVAELATLWNSWAEENNVLPLENRPWNNRIQHYQRQAARAAN